MRTLLFILIGATLLPQLSSAQDTPRAYIVSPIDGATISNPVTIVFGLSSYGVAPAGIVKEKTGHHHLLIDTKLVDLGAPIPNDTQHRHFGGGQTETTIDLEPGEHTLQLVLGNFAHVPHDPAIVSDTITITVEDARSDSDAVSAR